MLNFQQIKKTPPPFLDSEDHQDQEDSPTCQVFQEDPQIEAPLQVQPGEEPFHQEAQVPAKEEEEDYHHLAAKVKAQEGGRGRGRG